MKEHRKAVEYDLLTQTGHDINDIGRTLSWDALDSFLQFIGPDSALGRELYPEQAEWSTTLRTNKILADIYDVLAMLNANYVCVNSKNHVFRKPKKYPRPWKTEEPSEEKHFGRGALPPDELKKWIEEKRESHARSSSGDNYSHASDGGRSGKDNE